MHEAKETRIIIPPKTILTVLLTLLGLWVLYQVRDILTLFLIVVALVVTFSPIIRSWERYIPRTLAVAVLYTLFILGLILVGSLIVPVLVRQFSDFLTFLQSSLRNYGITSDTALSQLRDNLDLITNGQGIQALGQLLIQFRGSLGTVYTTTLNVLGGIIAVFTVLVSSFYLLLEERNFQQFLSNMLPDVHHRKVIQIMDRISDKMGNYLRGQVLLMVIVGIVTGIALAILGVPYPLLLGLWAGLMELLPFVGPIIGAIPGVFLAFSTLGPVKGLIALAIYFGVQQLEGQFLVPKIMGRALGLSPVAIIFALLIGGKLLGFIGLLIAVPIAAALAVIYEELRNNEAKTTKT